MNEPLPITFHVDQEHSGIQLTVLFILFASFLAAFLVLDGVLRAAFPQLNSVLVLSCLAALPVSLLLTGLSERLLKQRWRSGRRLVVQEDVLRLERPQQDDRVLERSQTVNALWWYLPLEGYPRGGRERRVPAKWFCVATQFQSDEARIVAYTYAPPARREEWTDRYPFRRLKPTEVYDTSVGARLSAPKRPEITAEIISGPDGRYWLAERNRWREGVELTPDDFERLLHTLRRDD